MSANDQILEKYRKSNPESSQYLEKGVEICKTLLSKTFESFIIGSAVREYYTNIKISSVKIITNASFEDLKLSYPSVIKLKNGNCYLKEGGRDYIITFFGSGDSVSKKISKDFYNKKLAEALEEEHFTVNALALSPNYNITNIFEGLQDIDNHLIRTIEKPKQFFSENPLEILNGLLLSSECGFDVENKTLKGMIKCCGSLDTIDRKVLIQKLRCILSYEESFYVIGLIDKNRLLRFDNELDSFINRINNSSVLSPVEQITILYLILGEIPDASTIEKMELKEITENITFAQLLMNDKVTPMMIYNIGEDRLLSADKILCSYKRKYSSQARLIKKLAKKSVINGSRELEFSELELREMLGGKTLKNKIVMNLLLERVINGDTPNYNKYLKEEALEIIRKLDEIFDYEEPEEKPLITEAYITDLIAKYHREFDFLVKIYLNDEKELYNLTPIEREDVIANAKEHAKSFLLETPQYTILEERELI